MNLFLRGIDKCMRYGEMTNRHNKHIVYVLNFSFNGYNMYWKNNGFSSSAIFWLKKVLCIRNKCRKDQFIIWIEIGDILLS